MNLVGIIGKNNFSKNFKKQHMSIINITEKNIVNIKNVKFQILIINDNLSEFKNMLKTLENIIKNSEYIILNSDLDIKIDVTNFVKKKIITFGFNPKSTVTTSSITEENILIDLQREIITLENNIVEPEEMLLKTNGNNDVYEKLISYSIKTILEK
ncbi:MAG: hypothetical protein IJH39_01915 [Clostridia bacterium]|nr:hypothetical protein [Clostridia bacterium]